MFENIHYNKVLHQQQAKKNSKISDFGGIPKMGRFGGFPWAKKLRQ